MILIESRKVKYIKELVNVIKEEAEKEGRFSLFHTRDMEDKFSRKMDYENCRRIYNKVIEHDSKCLIPYNVGTSIDRYTIGNRVFFHCMNLYLDDSNDVFDNKVLYSIMKDGLININKSNSTSIKCNMYKLYDVDDYINLVSHYDKVGHGYDTIILAGFPSDYIDLDGNLEANISNDVIYDTSLNTPKIRSNFILGAIIKNDNGLWNFYYRDKIIDSYDKQKRLIR